MPLTRAIVQRRADWQSACLERCATSAVWDSRLSDVEIARILGVDRSAIGHMRAGEDPMLGYHLAALAERVGLETVLGTTGGQPAASLTGAAAELGVLAARFNGGLLEALSDGVVTRAEAATLVASLLALRTTVDQEIAALQRLASRSP